MTQLIILEFLHAGTCNMHVWPGDFLDKPASSVALQSCASHRELSIPVPSCPIAEPNPQP